MDSRRLIGASAVALDKREGAVKDIVVRGGASAPLGSSEKVEDQDLWESHAESVCGGVAFHQPSIRVLLRP